MQIVLQELNLIPTLSVAENLFLADLPRRAGIVAATACARTRRGAAGGRPRRPRSATAGRPARRRPAATGRARGGAGAPVPRADPRRAHRGADRRRDRAGVRAPAPPRAAGTAILYISHRLEEIRRLCHRVTVLRDGRVVGERDAEDASIDEMVRLMVGEGVLDAVEHAPRTTGPVALRVEGLTRGRAAARRQLRGPPRRDPRPGRPRRLGPDRDAARHLRRRSADGGTHQPGRRPAARASAGPATPCAPASAWCRRIARRRACACRSRCAPT